METKIRKVVVLRSGGVRKGIHQITSANLSTFPGNIGIGINGRTVRATLVGVGSRAALYREVASQKK